MSSGTRHARRTRVIALLLVTTGLVAASFAVPAGADPTDRRSIYPMAVRRLHQNRAAVLRYWTAQRMQAAQPAPSPQPEPPQSFTRALAAAAPQGPMGGVAARPPAASRKTSTEYLPIPLAKAGPNDPIPYKRYEIKDDYRVFPLSAHGKVFFHDPVADLDYVCSATALNSRNLSVVWTAGHCVHGGGSTQNWYSNWIFVPAYKDGDAPLGAWTALELIAPPRWKNRGDSSFDFAAAVMESGPGRVVETVGGRGILWNVSRQQDFTSYGYPAAPPFDGETEFACESSYGFDDPDVATTPEPMGIGCDMTQGSSGGGWIVDVAPGNGRLNSVNSFSYDVAGFREVMFGPYLGDAAAALFTTAETSTLPGPLPDPGPTPSPNPTTPPPTGDVTPPAITGVGDTPDPFSPNGDGKKEKAKIFFSLSEKALVTVKILKSGKLVRLLASDQIKAGNWFLIWNGKNAAGQKVSNGSYSYRIEAVDAVGNSKRAGGTVTVKS